MDPDRIIQEKKKKKKKKDKYEFQSDEFRMNNDITPIDGFSDEDKDDAAPVKRTAK